MQELERIHIRCRKLNVHGAVEERLAIPVHTRHQLCHILQVALGCNGLLQVVGVGGFHAVFVGGIMDDALFLGRANLPGVDVKRHAVLLAEMPQDRLLLGAGGVLPQRPHTAVGVSEDVMVYIEFHNRRRNHIEEALDHDVFCHRRGFR